MDAPLLEPGLISRLIGRGLSHGGDFAEVYVQKRRSTGFTLDDGSIRSSSTGFEFGVGVRVIRGSAITYAWSEDTSEKALLECAEAAGRIPGGEGSPVVIARPLAPRARPHHADAQRRPSSIALEERLQLLRRADTSARLEATERHAHLEQIVGSWADVEEQVLLANSEGLYVTDARVLCRLGVEVIVRDDGGHRRTGTGGGGARTGVDYYASALTPEACGLEAVRMATAQLGARPAPVGEGVVVLGPASSGVLLHEAVGHGLEADFIRKRSSMFTGRLGHKVASELCTVVDDGTLPGRRGSLNIDDEGQPTSRTTLIERGVLTAYMSDRLNADLMGIERSGNGRRESFRHAPLPRMTNTFLVAGKDDPDEIVRGVSKGLYCKAFGGGQVDIANGNFVFEVREGYLIEDGHITAPVTGATLVGNGADTMQRITRVGHDASLDPGVYTCGKEGQSVPVGVGLPTVRIDGITIGGTGR